ncbi:hypothetical protein ACJMK2_030842 [Sinanodonta woodiana]|uniref:B box-type domain-containing protein n=1 Tax=Sinanodonta woodiana TaxID=1069815 RepID=A0ABD3X0H4_SINWO
MSANEGNKSTQAASNAITPRVSAKIKTIPKTPSNSQIAIVNGVTKKPKTIPKTSSTLGSNGAIPKTSSTLGSNGAIPADSTAEVAIGTEKEDSLRDLPKVSTPKNEGDLGNFIDPVCDMCDEIHPLESRCIQCNVNMCKDCAKHHPRMKISSKHDIVAYKGEPKKEKIKIEKEFCKKHPTEKLQFYCKVCKKALCINCKLTNHEGHFTRDLNEEVKEQREAVPVMLHQLKTNYLPTLKRMLREADDNEQELTFNVDNAVSSIQARTKQLQDDVTKASNNIVKKMKDKEGKAKTKITEKRIALRNTVQKGTSIIQEAEKVFDSGNDYEIMELYQNMQNVYEIFQEAVKKKSAKLLFKFKPGSMAVTGIENIIGQTVESNPPAKVIQPKGKASAVQVVPDLEAKQLSSFTCTKVPGSKISSIAPISHIAAWISFGWTTTEIFLYGKDGTRKSKVSLEMPIDDIAASTEGIFVSQFSGATVKHIDHKERVENVIEAPMKVRGLCVLANKEILCCGVDRCTVNPPPTKCSLLKFTSKGNKAGLITGDKKKKMPCHPYRVAENIDGSVCITDWLNDKEGRVIIFGNDGRARTIYTGGSTDMKHFLPYDICCDRYGHIIVGDVGNKEVHILDIKGHFIKVLLTKAHLVGERPYSLGIDQSGHLWVGNERAGVRVFRYLKPPGPVI